MEATARPSRKSRHRRHARHPTGSALAPPALGRANPEACLSLEAFALRLATKLAEIKTTGNLVFSPLSIYAALALAAAGARGATLHEFLRVLGVRSRNDLAEIVRGLAEQALADRSRKGGPLVTFACGVWHDRTKTLKPAYRDAAANSYKAEIRAVDFKNKPGAAMEEINHWIAEATNNLISSMINEVPVGTEIVLASAVYFKGKWNQPFNKMYTERGRFHRLDGSAIDDVPFMSSSRQQYIACHSGFKVLSLRYNKGWHAAGRHSMCVFLPDARDGLRGLVDKMAASPGFLAAHLPKKPVTVGDFRLPRFDLAFSGDMSKILRGLGLEMAFDERKSDLTNMAEDKGSSMPLVLQSIIHKAIIKVNEEGTEAAAATVVIESTASGMRWTELPVPVDFVADHPFAFFVIEEESGAVVFAGNVLEPSPLMPGEKLCGEERAVVFAGNVLEPWPLMPGEKLCGEERADDHGRRQPAASTGTNENTRKSTTMSPLRRVLSLFFLVMMVATLVCCVLC